VIKVSARARLHEDRAGDPLDGLVNMFDIGIVLAIAFLLAALASLHLSGSITKNGLIRPSDAITVPSGAVVSTVPAGAPTVAGEGTQVGTVYRTKDGRLIYVVTPTPSPTPS
jgi:hypothetical protein